LTVSAAAIIVASPDHGARGHGVAAREADEDVLA
jgi:hypothetical protein